MVTRVMRAIGKVEPDGGVTIVGVMDIEAARRLSPEPDKIMVVEGKFAMEDDEFVRLAKFKATKKKEDDKVC